MIQASPVHQIAGDGLKFPELLILVFSDVSDENESDDVIKADEIKPLGSVADSETGSLGPFTMMLVICVFAGLRRRMSASE